MKAIHALPYTLLLMLLLLLGGCSSKSIIGEETIEVHSQETVSVEASSGYDSYLWRQVSGISVEIADSHSAVLRFIAPEVEREETLVFTLEAVVGKNTVEDRVTVIVSPVDEDGDATGGSDDNTTSEDDNSTTGGGTDDNTTTGEDNNDTTGGNDDNTSNGDDDNTTTGGGDDNGTTGGDTDTNTTTLQILTLSIAESTLPKETNTTLTLTASYNDGTSKSVTDDIEWITMPSDAVSIHGDTLTAIKDTNVTLRARHKGKLSNKVNLNIYWEVNGHRLPPEPDPKINNATLLGVDVNHNDVRDDVERWIYEKYKDKHPIHIDIAMQAARGYKLVLEHPERAKEIHDEVRKARHCEYYYKYDANEFNESILIDKDFSRGYLRDKIYFNTKKRHETYIKYDTLLSGDSYTLPSPQEEKAACDFNTSKYGKE